jgi:hypothetical protein
MAAEKNLWPNILHRNCASHETNKRLTCCASDLTTFYFAGHNVGTDFTLVLLALVLFRLQGILSFFSPPASVSIQLHGADRTIQVRSRCVFSKH